MALCHLSTFSIVSVGRLSGPACRPCAGKPVADRQGRPAVGTASIAPVCMGSAGEHLGTAGCSLAYWTRGTANGPTLWGWSGTPRVSARGVCGEEQKAVSISKKCVRRCVYPYLQPPKPCRVGLPYPNPPGP